MSGTLGKKSGTWIGANWVIEGITSGTELLLPPKLLTESGEFVLSSGGSSFLLLSSRSLADEWKDLIFE